MLHLRGRILPHHSCVVGRESRCYHRASARFSSQGLAVQVFLHTRPYSKEHAQQGPPSLNAQCHRHHHAAQAIRGTRLYSTLLCWGEAPTGGRTYAGGADSCDLHTPSSTQHAARSTQKSLASHHERRTSACSCARHNSTKECGTQGHNKLEKWRQRRRLQFITRLTAVQPGSVIVDAARAA